MGVDLAGSVKRKTGVALLDGLLNCRCVTVYADEDIIKMALKESPDVIVIDAPLSIPRGRKDIEDRSGPHFRACDVELRKIGIKFFPVTLGPMRMLTERGIKLSKKLSSLGFRVIESYPGGVQDVLNIPRKKNMKGLIDGLKKLGIKGCSDDMNDHEADAATIAYLGMLFLEGSAVPLGDPDEGLLYLPKKLTQP
jgi:predicted nuclease with RNAse H fold